MGNYEFDFNENGPYGAAVRLLAGTDPHGKIVLDIGCGAAAVADPITASGATYVGIDVDAAAIEALAARGLEGHVVDLTAPDLATSLDKIVSGRSVAAVLCLDVLEHVPDPSAVLTSLGVIAEQDAELIISIPNVAHVDLARQLLAGRWEMTESGLLDRTHVRFFTESSLTELTTTTGWYESAREDFLLEQSDQHRALHPLFEPKTNVGSFLRTLRDEADDFGSVNQFVRRYHRGARRAPAAQDAGSVFLSIVIRTQGKRPLALSDVLCCLGAQTDLDFEVVIVVHDSTRLRAVQELVDDFEGNLAQRVRTLSCDGGTRSVPANVGLRAARGDYVVFLDDDDLVLANYVENVHEGAAEAPGTIVRWWAAEQKRTWGDDGYASGPLTPTYATRFDMLRHLRQNETPFHCFAFPRRLVELGFAFNETLTVCEDWDFLVRAASLCGVHDTEQMTAIYNKWSDKSSAHVVNPDEWLVMRALVHVELDKHALMLPPGSARNLDRVLERNEISERRIAELEAELAAIHQVSHNAHHALNELRSSTSWKFSAPVRAFGNIARRVRRR
ncbi:methyltransferase domain-containing protein [Lentzea sp. NPDC006480]|uniref:methyltransferase domain-containing protein n=1 Tax=Lentzea sp. NPDC006480 TaxID=3157176 RepID=UPI0033A22FD4